MRYVDNNGKVCKLLPQINYALINADFYLRNESVFFSDHAS